MCNRHLSIDNLIDHRSYERQGKLKVPTIHEGADARKIEEKYLTGQIRKGSWKVEENQMIKKQNALLQKVIATFGKVSGALSMWREWLNDEESKEVIPMMEAMITQIEEQQNIMAEMLQEIQEKDEKLMCFQEQEERLQQLEKELSELLYRIQKNC